MLRRPELLQLLFVAIAPVNTFHMTTHVRSRTVQQFCMQLDHVDDASFEQKVVEASATKPVLVDWSADWCGPCKLIEPLLEELHDTGAVSVVKAKPELASNFLAWLRKKGRKYKVVALPTVILFADGVPTKTHVGRLSREQLLDFVGVTSSTPAVG